MIVSFWTTVPVVRRAFRVPHHRLRHRAGGEYAPRFETRQQCEFFFLAQVVRGTGTRGDNRLGGHPGRESFI